MNLTHETFYGAVMLAAVHFAVHYFGGQPGLVTVVVFVGYLLLRSSVDS